MHSDEIRKFIKNYNNCDVDSIKRLTGGMSNYVYLIEYNNSKYIFRIPGAASEHFSNTNTESDVIDKLVKRNFIEEPIYFDINSGYKISKCIEGLPLNEISTEDKDFNKIAACLKDLHKGPLFSETYDYLDDIRTLESKVIHKDVTYDLLKEAWLCEALVYLSDIDYCPCHCDSQPNNFIRDNEGNIHLIDWELAMNNDPIFDIACFGESDFNEAIILFNHYYDNPSLFKLKKLYLWRVFQCLKWYNGALFKEEYGLSKELLVDFKHFAGILLNEALYLFKEYQKL